MAINGKGGLQFIIEGECTGFRPSTNKTSGVVSQTANVAYFGGEQYLTLANAKQAELLIKGAWVKFSAGARKFKDSVFPDHATLLEVNGKPVPAAG